jgi:hypothetical protein
MRTRGLRSVSGDIAEHQVAMFFLERGWTAQKVTPDYGEDLMVRIFDRDGQSTPYIFFVQVKGKQEHRVTQERNQYDFLIEKPHYDSWMTFWQPMFLVVWDHKKKTGRWDWVQTPKVAPAASHDGKIIFGLPYELTEEGLLLMEGLVRQHYRASFTQDALLTEVFDVLKKEHNIQVDLDGDAAAITSGQKYDAILADHSAERLQGFGRAVSERKPDQSHEELASNIQKGLGVALGMWSKEYQADPVAFVQRFGELVVAMKEADARLSNEEPNKNE